MVINFVNLHNRHWLSKPRSSCIYRFEIIFSWSYWLHY